MSFMEITDANGVKQKVDVVSRTEGADILLTQAMAIIDPPTGNVLKPNADGSLSVAGVATAANQATGNSSLSSIDSKLTGVASEATLAQVRDSIRAQIDIASTIWTDNSGAFYVRRDSVNQGTGVVSVIFTAPDGTTATPGAGLRPLATTDRDITQALFDAIASGTGYSSGDLLGRVLIVDANVSPASVTAIWVNLTSGAVIAAPAGGTIERADETINARQSGAWNVGITSSSANLATETGGNLESLATNVGTAATAAAAADGTGNYGVIAGIKRALLNWAALLARLPASLGPKASSASFPVVMADDTTITGSAGLSALNTDLLTGTLNGWYDAGSFQSGSIQIIAGAGISAGAVIFEQTNDTSAAPAGVALRAYEVSSVNTNPVVAAVTIAASTARIWTVPINSRFIRVRISTAFVGGTVQAVATLSQRAASFPVVNVQQATAANLNATVSGTVTANIGTGALAAGTNAIGDVGVQYRANATGAATPSKVIAAATTNATNIKASAGRLLGWQLQNTTASPLYVKFHNQSTAPTAGASVLLPVAIPANGKSEITIDGGIAFGTGIGYTIVTGSADTDATAVTAGAVVGSIHFA